MLNERHASKVTYDPAADTTTIEVGPPASAEKRVRTATLLLDPKGTLVGVDLRGNDPAGWIVMLGPHESVSTTREATVELRDDAEGAPAEIRVPGARALA